MEYVNIALPKGRLGEEGYKILEKIGLDFEEYKTSTRKLTFTNEKEKIRLILVKPSDVPIYVERGACDIGIAGKDVIMEENRNLYELIDLGFGKCKFSIASIKEYKIQNNGLKIRVATKYPNISKSYFVQKNMEIDLIKLNGSVELAPLVGLSDVIVDLVESGKTLKENGLSIIEDMYDISARLICNKVSFKTKNHKIKKIIDSMNNILKSGEQK